MRRPSQYVTAEVEVYLDEFDTDALIEELEHRGVDYNTKFVDADEMRKLLEKIYHNRKQNIDYQKELDDLIWGVLGRM